MTSKIKVDNIENQCGGAVVTKCGGTTTISGTVVKSNTLQASDAGNIISQSGTTITLGATGDNIVLAGGATQSGFGRTGTVDWQTGAIKTSTFTAANGEGYFANTSGGAFNMNLPAGVVGNIVSVVDYTNTFGSNNLTLVPNGSEKIGGIAANATLDTTGQSLTFVYVDSTEGWKNVQDSTSAVTGVVPFLTASVSGACNTLTTSGNCKIATFVGPGTFTVCQASTTPANNEVSYMIVAGGGGGQPYRGGGGGAGGFREAKTPLTPYTASPLDGYPNVPNRVSVSTQGFPITVGGGGGAGISGSNSVFSTITSTGGGGGGLSGGSGGGNKPFNTGGAGNTPPVSPPQGNNGGPGQPGSSPPHWGAGGGGGASTVGATGQPSNGGNGGDGVATSITSSSVTRSGGGGGGAIFSAPSPGGGSGGGGPSPSNSDGQNGTVNTGGGAGGANSTNDGTQHSGGTGGSGIVIIRYKFQ